MDGQHFVAASTDPDLAERARLAGLDDAVHVDAVRRPVRVGGERRDAPFLTHRIGILRREIEEFARERVELLAVLAERRAQAVMVDDTDLLREPLLPALGADAGLDLGPARRGQPRPA